MRARGPALLAAAALAAFAAACPAPEAEAPEAEPQTPRGGFTAVRVEGRGPILDADAPFWADAQSRTVALVAQTVARPMHPSPSVTEIEVRAAHNGEWLGLLLTWDDETEDDWMRLDEFGDQVAVQLPMDPSAGLPSPMMGHPGGQVNIMQWRAAFQRDLADGAPGIRDLYPYALVDVYPDEVLQVVDARAYMGALGMDNPVSRPFESPVLDQMAEGFGTLTVKPVQLADGRGAWSDGVWRVVITRPLHPLTKNDPDLRPGIQTSAAFAVWDGGADEVGSRKSWSSWVPLRIAE